MLPWPLPCPLPLPLLLSAFGSLLPAFGLRSPMTLLPAVALLLSRVIPPPLLPFGFMPSGNVSLPACGCPSALLCRPFQIKHEAIR